MAEFQLGSISTGTLRQQDLLAAFLPYLNKESEHAQEAQAVLERITTDTWPPGIDNLEQYLTEFNTSELLDIIMDELQELCPPFVYFGTLEGDGADFGFWPDWDALGDIGAQCVCDICEHQLLEYEIIVVKTKEAYTVMDMERNVLWSVV